MKRALKLIFFFVCLYVPLVGAVLLCLYIPNPFSWIVGTILFIVAVALNEQIQEKYEAFGDWLNLFK